MGQVIGFVGWPCAGKDVAAGYLQRVYGARRFGHSDTIRKLAAEQGNMSPTTQHLSAVFEAQAAVNGYGWIARKVRNAIEHLWLEKPDALVVISGVRNLAEVEIYREIEGFLLVKIEADFKVRLARARRLQEMGEKGLTRSRFQGIEQLPGNANIPDLMKIDGPTISNNGEKLAPFHSQLDQLVVKRD
ncbi:hypothetical protein EPN81_00910 [Patescibacteria group bacterium]|nr:MAG: hypothetical protein EPN81_00910 [Patescibacteria group bacterium]